MSGFMFFSSPLEFLLRYTVITGVILAIIGAVIVMTAKHITMSKHGRDNFSKNDKLYVTLVWVGLSLILVGMIFIALPIEATFYKG